VSYLSEFPADYEVPPVFLRWTQLGLLVDASWHNDACPKFEYYLPNDPKAGIRIWVDAATPDDREVQGSKRFTVSLFDAQDHEETWLTTDCLEDVIKYMSEHWGVVLPGQV
jgi:hypothetical protein